MTFHRATKANQVLAALGDGEVTTAQKLAANIKVSERTIYRYIKYLRAGGAPIRGEAGTGFQLRRKPEGATHG